jgi:hypothetical protein
MQKSDMSYRLPSDYKQHTNRIEMGEVRAPPTGKEKGRGKGKMEGKGKRKEREEAT